MRIAILADIHGNLEALSAVLADAQKRDAADSVWCLGDTVGYGPDPRACIDTLLGTSPVAVAGNHDWAIVGKVSLREFNPYAALACRWTLAQLSPAHIDYLVNLPLQVERGPFTLVHGSPRDPIWEYLVSLTSARACFQHLSTPYCLVGHSHVPFMCREGQGTPEMVELPGNTTIPLGEERLIVNPGSVGQPRDGDPRASYAIYHQEESSLEIRRVSYDLRATQRKMRLAGLPEPLAERLQYGR